MEEMVAGVNFGEKGIAHIAGGNVNFFTLMENYYRNICLKKYTYLFLKNFYLFIYFKAVLDLRFCARAFSSCGKWGPLFITVRGPLIIVASLLAEHRLQTRRLSNCGSRA